MCWWSVSGSQPASMKAMAACCERWRPLGVQADGVLNSCASSLCPTAYLQGGY